MSRLSAVKGKEERSSIYCVPNSNAPGSYSVHSACWAGAPLKSEGLRDDFSEAPVGLGLPFQIYALGQEGPIGLVPYVQEGHRDLNLRQVVPSLMSFPSLPGKDFGFVLFCLFFFSPCLKPYSASSAKSTLRPAWVFYTSHISVLAASCLPSTGLLWPHWSIFGPIFKIRNGLPVSSVQRQCRKEKVPRVFRVVSVRSRIAKIPMALLVYSEGDPGDRNWESGVGRLHLALQPCEFGLDINFQMNR